MQSKLKILYQAWKADLACCQLDLRLFSPPLLVKIPPVYEKARHRTLYIGQETFTWEWMTEPAYPNWNYSPLHTLGDFVRNSDSVEALTEGYGMFAFSKARPQNANSPFWMQFRRVQQRCPQSELIWLNLFMCCRKTYPVSMLHAPADIRASFLAIQKKIMLEQVGILAPDCVVFLTGPNYDPFFGMTFGPLDLVAVSDIPIRQLARITKCPALPERAFRTYHPNYLQRAGLLSHIDDILSEILK